MRAIADGVITATTTVEAVQEFTHIRAGAATAHAAGAGALVSADGGFSAVPNIRHVIPDANGIRSVLDQHQGR